MDRTVGRRAVRGASLDVSAIGIKVDPPAAGGPLAEEQLIARLRAAREKGVTLFDLTSSRSTVRAERLLRKAFPRPDSELAVLVGETSEPRLDGRVPALGRSLPPSEPAATHPWARLAEDFSVIVEATQGEDLREPIGVRLAQLESLSRDGKVAAWSLRIEGEDPIPPDALEGQDVTRFGVEASLLDPARVRAIDARADRHASSVFVRGPFADGRLDGSRFASELALHGPPAPPVDVGTLRAEFAPVLRLGFLTEGHRRTLAQAALQYFLSRPWLAAVLVPLPRPERLTEILAAEAAPALSSEERRGLTGQAIGEMIHARRLEAVRAVASSPD